MMSDNVLWLKNFKVRAEEVSPHETVSISSNFHSVALATGYLFLTTTENHVKDFGRYEYAPNASGSENFRHLEKWFEDCLYPTPEEKILFEIETGVVYSMPCRGEEET